MPSDDAGGGRRGRRAAASPGLLGAVRDGYGLDGVAGAVDLGGSSNLNLLVRDGARSLVVRVYRPHVTAARLGAVQAVRRALAASGLPCPGLVPARDGRPWLAYDGRLVEAEAHVEHDGNMDSWERLEAGLPTLGRIHTVLRGAAGGGGEAGKRPLFANHVGPAGLVEGAFRGTRRIRGWATGAADLRLADAADELAARVEQAERRWADALPRQLVHGDFWDNNVLFQRGRVAAVVDFDFMGERARIDDLALTLYFASMMEKPEGASSGDQRARLCALVDAYGRGLGQPLSEAERAALPLALARQPLWSIAVWVAHLDDEAAAREHAAGTARALPWGLAIVSDLGRWQRAFGALR